MLLGGHVDAAVAATSAGKEHVVSGTLRMLAVQHKEGFTWAREVPTFANWHVQVAQVASLAAEAS
jgi:tripartite-type tricarboxylate transporter receptor subunit TctC